jgi:peptidoglycan/LPS O-acetylase OafA/YrhL
MYHLGYGWMGGGFLGVDAFFVLSGYLITSLLLAEHRRTATISLTSFWARRAKRLLPPLVVVIGAVAAFTAFWADDEVRASLRGDALAAIGYVANWRFVVSGQSYFNAFADPSPLRHTWSLAIEEQFYLVWPLLVVAMIWFARGRAWALGLVAAFGAAASVAAMNVLRGPDHSRAYYGTDTRIHELLIGALLAILVQRGPLGAGRLLDRWHRVWQLLSLLAISAIVIAFAIVEDKSVFYYRGGSLVFALAVATLILTMERGEGPIARVLGWRPVVWVGVTSYGLYLYHWPILLWIDERVLPFRGQALKFAQVAILVGVSAASYYALEKPIRSGTPLGLRLTTRRAIVAAPAALVFAAVLVLAGGWGASTPVWAKPGVGQFVELGERDAHAPRSPSWVTRSPGACCLAWTGRGDRKMSGSSARHGAVAVPRGSTSWTWMLGRRSTSASRALTPFPGVTAT